jgi:FkbM family methyltransferase
MKNACPPEALSNPKRRQNEAVMLDFTEETLRDMIHEHFDDPAAVYQGYSEGRIPSPLHLRNGLVIYHDPSDAVESLFYEIVIRRCYTGENFYCPQPHHTVFDLGANIGIFALYLSKLAPGIQVHCFEPSMEARECLLQNVSANALAGTVHVYPFAIFNESGKKNLLKAKYSPCNSFFSSPNIVAEQSSTMVSHISLAEALEYSPVESIDFLKMDVEGAEIEILESADSRVWNRILRMATEYHADIRPGCLPRIDGLLKEHGFDTSVDNQPPYGNTEVILKSQRIQAGPLTVEIDQKTLGSDRKLQVL